MEKIDYCNYEVLYYYMNHIESYDYLAEYNLDLETDLEEIETEKLKDHNYKSLRIIIEKIEDLIHIDKINNNIYGVSFAKRRKIIFNDDMMIT
jgi:glutathionyl-hydroquinone reductase